MLELTVVLAVLALLGFEVWRHMAFRTDIVTKPNGLCFKCARFSVDVDYAEKTISVRTSNGVFQSLGNSPTEDSEGHGSVAMMFPAAGFAAQIGKTFVRGDAEGNQFLAGMETGFSTISFISVKFPPAAEGELPHRERTIIQVKGVPNDVAVEFGHFHAGIDVWLGKLEQRLLKEHYAQIEIKTKAEREQRRAEELAKNTLTEEQRLAKAQAQLDGWRKQADFSGDYTEMSCDHRGRITWLIDATKEGYGIIHSGGRTFMGKLTGARVRMLPDQIEVAVRGEDWDQMRDNLTRFRILAGTPKEKHIEWRDRLAQMAKMNRGATERHAEQD